MNYQKCGCREGGHFGTCELRKAPSPVRLLAEKITQYFLPEPQLGIAVNIAYVESLIQAEISTLEFGHAAEIAGMKNVLSLRIAEAKRETDIRSRTSGYYNGKEKGRSEGYQDGRIQAFEEAAKIAEEFFTEPGAVIMVDKIRSEGPTPKEWLDNVARKIRQKIRNEKECNCCPCHHDTTCHRYKKATS